MRNPFLVQVATGLSIAFIAISAAVIKNNRTDLTLQEAITEAQKIRNNKMADWESVLTSYLGLNLSQIEKFAPENDNYKFNLEIKWGDKSILIQPNVLVIPGGDGIYLNIPDTRVEEFLRDNPHIKDVRDSDQIDATYTFSNNYNLGVRVTNSFKIDDELNLGLIKTTYSISSRDGEIEFQNLEELPAETKVFVELIGENFGLDFPGSFPEQDELNIN